MAKWLLFPLRVRYQETDQMGVVYHANYLNWFEIGRTEWVRRAGISYKQMEERGLLLPVTDAEASFKQPASYDEWITVCTSVAQMGAIRVKFESRIVAGDLLETCDAEFEGEEPPGKLLVRGSTRHVWLNRQWKPIRLDREAPEWFAAMEQLAGGGLEAADPGEGERR